MSAPTPPDPTTTRLFSNQLPPQRDSTTTRPTTTTHPPHQQQQPILHPHPPPNSFPRHHHHHQPLYPNQRLHHHNNQPPQPQPNNKPQIQDPTHHQGNILYPVASSGRGFLPRPNHNHNQTHRYPAEHQSVPIPNSSARTNSAAAYPYGRPFGVPLSDPLNQAMHLVRPNNANLHQSLLGSTGGGGAMANIVRGVPVSSNPKVAPSPSSVLDSNGMKDIRERSKDDNFATIRDRKVKLSEGSSLYSLCRSWMKNSVSEENQPRYGESVKSLPKPLPAHVADANSEVNKEDDKEENVEDVENLTSKELLQRHIKRAKKVRARLREERLQRIARYKGRLALLLPPVVEQQFKNDSSASAN